MLSHIDLILLVVGGRPDKLLPAVDHFTAASSLPVQIHVVTDVPFVPGDYPISYRTHSLEERKLPEAALRMHRKFAKVTHGAGNIYMWKPAPSAAMLSLVERVDQLDLDVFIPRGCTLRRCIATLTPFHERRHRVAKGSNRDDDNPHIARGEGRTAVATSRWMRVAQSGSSTALCHQGDIASALGVFGACGDIGYLGDQTFYSALATRHPFLLHMLPCGWNHIAFQFQLSSRDYTRRRWRATTDARLPRPSRLVHANQPRFARRADYIHWAPTDELHEWWRRQQRRWWAGDTESEARPDAWGV